MNSYVVEFQTVFLPDLILDYLLFGLQVFLSCDVESLEVMECNFVWHFVTFKIWKEIYFSKSTSQELELFSLKKIVLTKEDPLEPTI